MEVGARHARADEVDLVATLGRGAIDELRSHRGGDIWSQWEARPEPLDAAFRTLEASDTGALLVGLIDGAIVGYAAVTIQALHDGRIVGHVTDLYVLPDARGVGVGEALMDEITEWCRANDCVGIDSVALPGDRATKNFFETFGLVARALRVHRSL